MDKQSNLRKKDSSKFNVLQLFYKYATLFKGSDYQEIMPVFPLPVKCVLGEASKVLDSRQDGKFKQQLQLSINSDKCSLGTYHVITITQFLYEPNNTLIDKNINVLTLSIPRFIVIALEIIKGYDISQNREETINDLVMNILEGASPVEISTSYISKVSVDIKVGSNNKDTLLSVMKGVAIKEYNPCFCITTGEKFKESVISLLEEISKVVNLQPTKKELTR